MNHELEPMSAGPNGRLTARVPPGPEDPFSQVAMVRGKTHRLTNALWRRWWVFVLSFLIIGVPAVYFTMVQPPRFESKAIMWVATQPNLPQSRLYLEGEGMTTYIGTQAQLFKSRILQERALAEIRSLYPEVAAITNEPPFELSVRTSTKASILELKATGPSSASTQAFLDAVMEEYRAFKADSRKQSSSGPLSTLTDEIKKVQEQVRTQQNQLTRFQVSNNISYLTEHGLSAGSHLARLQETLSDLRTEYRLLTLLTPGEFRSLSQRPEISPSGTVVPGERESQALAVNSAAPQSAYYQALQQLQLLKARRDEFSKVLRPTHSKMQKLSQEIDGLEQLLKKLESLGEEQALAQMNNRKKSIELQIENLEAQYRSWETNAAHASAMLAEYDLMKQETQRSQALYDRL